MVDRDTLTMALEIIAQSEDRNVGVVAKAIKAQISDLVVSTCDDDDVLNVEPLAQTPEINLYMLASSGSCLNLTADPKSMIGLVLAQVTDEE